MKTTKKTSKKTPKKTKTQKRPRRRMTAAGKTVRFSTIDILNSLARGAVKRVDALAQAVGDESRDGRRKLSVMLNRAKRAGHLKHTPTKKSGRGSGGTWALTAKGAATLMRDAYAEGAAKFKQASRALAKR
ncbi:MAG: hypothetical protein ACREND_14230 [Gemmatimonadaceae bacterium]